MPLVLLVSSWIHLATSNGEREQVGEPDSSWFTLPSVGTKKKLKEQVNQP